LIFVKDDSEVQVETRLKGEQLQPGPSELDSDVSQGRAMLCQGWTVLPLLGNCGVCVASLRFSLSPSLLEPHTLYKVESRIAEDEFLALSFLQY
jgi:hypothetical protein